MFDAALIANQLRCAGVIEALRVSRLGYPQRYSHQQFLSRYRMLGMKALRKTRAIPSAKALVHAICEEINSVNEKGETIGIEVGKTKIFLVQTAYDKLEKLRRDKITSSVITIQKWVRGLIYKKRYKSMCRSALIIQCHLRRVQATRVVWAMRREYSSIKIQNLGRGHIARKQLLSAKAIARWCQALYRGKLDRIRYNKIRRNSKALHLQSCWRRYVAVRSFRAQLASVLVLQCCWRSKIARNEFRKLKLEARDFQVVAQERDRLREELSFLRQTNSSLQSQQFSTSPQSLSDKEDENKSLRKEIEKVLREKEAVENELKDVKNAASSFHYQKDILIDERDRLFAENEHLRSIIHSHLDLSTIDRVTVENKARVSLMCGKKHSLKTALSEIDKLMLANLVISKENIELREELRSLCSDLNPSKFPHMNKEDKECDDPFPSVCTSLTVDMTEIDDEPYKLRDDNRRLTAELSLLRSNYEELTKELCCSDHGCDILIDESETLQKEFSSVVVPNGGCTESCEKVSRDSISQELDSIRVQLPCLIEGKDKFSQEIQFQTEANHELRSLLVSLNPPYGDKTQDIREYSKYATIDIDDLNASSSEIQELKTDNYDIRKKFGVLEAVNLGSELDIHNLKSTLSPEESHNAVAVSDAKFSINSSLLDEELAEYDRVSKIKSRSAEEHSVLRDENYDNIAASAANFPHANSTIETESSKLIDQLSSIMCTYMGIEKKWDCLNQGDNFASESNFIRDSLSGHVLKQKSEDGPVVSQQSNVDLLNKIKELEERLDDVKRANRSLREDLDNVTNEKMTLCLKL